MDEDYRILWEHIMHDDFDWDEAHRAAYGNIDDIEDNGPLDVESQVDWEAIYAEAEALEQGDDHASD